MKPKKDRSRYLFYVIAIGVLILFALILLSSLLDIGEKLRKINPYVEYGFYGLVVILTYLVIIQPIIIILRSPSLSIATTLDQNDPKAVAIYKELQKILLKVMSFLKRKKNY